MAIPLLAGAAKGLLAGAGKKAVASGAKKFVTGKKKQKTPGYTSKESKKDVGKKVKSKVRPKQKKVSTVSLPKSVYKNQSNSATSTTDKNVSFESLGKQLDNINKTTKTLVDVEKTEAKNKKELNKAVRAQRRKDKLASKEEQLEKKKGGGVLGGVIKTTGKSFGIFDFLSNIALGSLALFAINNYQAIEDVITSLSENFTNPLKFLQTTYISYL